MEKEKNKKTMLIVGVVVALVIIIVIIALAVSGGSKDKDGKDSSQKSEGGKVTEEDKSGIKSFSSYGNYRLTTTASLVTNDDIQIDVINDMTIDTKNSMIKSTITTVGIAQYFYFDLNNKISYYSLDNSTWSKNSPVEMFLPDFSVLIGKLQKGTGVTKTKDGDFKLTTDVELSGETIKDIPVTVSLDKDGYISKILYEVSSTREEAKSYNVVYELSEVGKASGVEVPATIVQNASIGNEATMISFYK